MVGLSKRMEAVCGLLTPGGVLADVGCDHGLVSVAMVQRGIVPSAIAMDLREGPLSRARERIDRCGLSDRIETRLSDGVTALAPGEADAILIAGMGGEVILHILSCGERVFGSAAEVILQPQSQIDRVRRYLRENDYCIVAEDMVCEDGKYYPMMRVLNGRDTRKPSALEDLYGPLLLENAHPVLREFLVWEEKRLLRIEAELTQTAFSAKTQKRLEELHRQINDNRNAMQRCGIRT